MAPPNLRARLASDPSGDLAAIAIEEGVSARAVVEAMPDTMRDFADGGFFANAIVAIARWGDVTTVVHTDAGNVTITGPMPKGRMPRRPATVAQRLGVAGRLTEPNCGGIAFVERTASGGEEAAVLFFGQAGALMMEVHLIHDAAGQLQPEQLAAFRALREAVVPETDPD